MCTPFAPYQKKAHELADAAINRLVACRAVLRAAEKVDPDLAVMDEVSQCTVTMRRILAEASVP